MSGSLKTRPYNAGNAGVASIAEAEITFSAAAARQLVCTVPEGAVILRAWVEVKEAFNAGVSNLLTMGYGAVGAGTADDIVSAVDESQASVSAAAGPFATEAADKDVYVYYTPGNGAASTGKASAFVEYARLAANG